MENNNNNEFKVLGQSMEHIAVYYGSFLIIWGISISFISNSSSLTSLIPSFFGFPILVFGALTIKFHEKKKLFMHIAVTFGLLTFIGGLEIVRGILRNNLFTNFYADLSKFMMLVTGLVFTILCVKSFIFARKNRV